MNLYAYYDKIEPAKTKAGFIMVKKKDTAKKLKLEFLRELEKKYNCGVARYLMKVNEKNLDKTAIFYRGKKVTYDEMFKKAFDYAASMKSMGIKKGMEIPMCLANCPETIYTILAASLIGAKINIFGNVFDKDYIEEIIAGTDAKVLFVTDDMYKELKDIIPKTNIEKIVMFSLTDSYPNGQNPYAELEKGFYDGVNRVPLYKQDNDTILNSEEFVALGKNFEGEIEEDSTLEDEFSITYSSGSTNSQRPKAIKHRVRSFNAMGMAHDGYDTPKMKNLRVLVQIPTHSNTCIISSITDTLSQGCCCNIEYIYDQNFFARSLLINKPNYVFATRTFWVTAFKEFLFNKAFKNVKLPFLLVPMAVGEPTSPGEEKFFNKMLRKLKAGTGIIPLPVSPIVMSLAGGDCEHGGIFFNLFKALREKDPRRAFKKAPLGYSTYRMVEYAVLDENRNHCKPFEMGTLVADSPTNMIGYKNNEEATNEFFVKDARGHTYGTCNTYGYIDDVGGIHIKGRIPSIESIFPTYIIQDEILKDTKRILSCEVVELENGVFVAHIEKQPDINWDLMQVFKSIEARLGHSIPAEIQERLVFKIRSGKNSFPTTACGKRSNNTLLKDALHGTLKLSMRENRSCIIDGELYLDGILNSKTMQMDKQN